ncbi:MULTISPECIES: hypothetical protein [Serratia]|uniref:hypothetical protein n=1 Tax=Serratia TaxID=613 RepID=UPI000A1767B6|nr:hypothetical protein [Serratia marcescens]AWC73604.1 hypothetical protein AM371_01000 [Serratia marcescens]EIJ6702008.1 hypothetical protein [Serratia marcescens]EIV5186764.1 hypothetical protein [Serratia marcescens]EIY2711316.1 hypothetical protein [Serratia marcescens]KAB1980951.1 hypothetical protein F8B69_17495 [Serratia marcescens]
MQAIGFIIYLAIGVVQLAAVMAGLESWWGVSGFFSFIIAAIIAYIPILGTVVGMAGAMKAWHWEWWQAGGLFFGALILTFAMGGIAGLAEWFSNRKRV